MHSPKRRELVEYAHSQCADLVAVQFKIPKHETSTRSAQAPHSAHAQKAYAHIRARALRPYEYMHTSISYHSFAYMRDAYMDYIHMHTNIHDMYIYAYT